MLFRKTIFQKRRLMKFIVRYWSSLLPSEADGQIHWLDYSVHPPTKLGLHNALLAAHDRIEILDAHGGMFECAVFVEDEEGLEKLSPEAANSMFGSLPPGAVKWLDIGNFSLPEHPNLPHDETSQKAQQLPLFAHGHTPYDKHEEPPHSLDIDI